MNNLTHGGNDITNAMQKDFTKLKRRRTEEKKESNLKIYISCLYSNVDPSEVNDLMRRIINFLLYVSKNIDNNFNWETNKDLILKVFDYLKDYKLNNPIDFLKVINVQDKFTYIFKHILFLNRKLVSV